jgi:hypothetical protein
MSLKDLSSWYRISLNRYVCPQLQGRHYSLGTVASGAETANQQITRRLLISAAHNFVPVAAEMLGPVGNEAIAFLTDLRGCVAVPVQELRETANLMQSH